MHNPEFVQENETQKLRWNFKIQMDILILTRRLKLLIFNNNKKRTNKIVDLAVPANHRKKLKEKNKKDKYLDLDSELEKLWNMKVTVIQIVIGAIDTVTKWLIKGLEELEIRGRGDNSNNSIVVICQNTEKNPGDMRRLVSLKVLWKTNTVSWYENLD